MTCPDCRIVAALREPSPSIDRTLDVARHIELCSLHAAATDLVKELMDALEPLIGMAAFIRLAVPMPPDREREFDRICNAGNTAISNAKHLLGTCNAPDSPLAQNKRLEARVKELEAALAYFGGRYYVSINDPARALTILAEVNAALAGPAPGHQCGDFGTANETPTPEPGTPEAKAKP